MIFKLRPSRDLYRWRYRFALWPKRVGERKVLFEWYAWRYLPKSEGFDIVSMMFQTISQEFVLKSGYAAVKVTTISVYSFGLLASSHWERPKPYLVEAA